MISKDKRLLLIVLSLTLVLSYFFARYINSEVDLPQETKNAVGAKVSLSDKEYFQCIRVTLDSYLADTVTDPVLIDGLGDQKTGLRNFSSAYYLSKFVVYQSYDSLAGGKQIDIVFITKPDKLFTTWVYELADGTCELRGFGENDRFNKMLFSAFVKSINTRNTY